MAKGFDVLHIKSAVKARNKFDLSRTHLTTMDFGEIVPLFVEETIPGDQYNIQGNYFSRMAPMVVPTYGKFSFRTMTAFVPYHQIADDVDAWMAGKQTWEGESTRQRVITVWQLALFIRQYCVTTTGATATNTDYTYVSSNGTTIYNVFTAAGKYYVKVLNALGYAIPEKVDFQTGTWQTWAKAKKLSAYPLLAFFKAYNDYMSQSQRYNTSLITSILRSIKHNVDVSNTYTASTGEISYSGLYSLFNNLKLNYENDYFTSAWAYPNSAIGITTDGTITGEAVPADSYETVFATDDFNRLTTTYANAVPSVSISQRALDFLRSFEDWVRRNNYSGSRAVQQVYSRFGIKSDDYRSNYAHVLKTEVLPVQVGDVTATTMATDQPLGDYAGKGIMNGSKGFSFKADDYGLLVQMGYFTVIPMNAYGYDRRVLRNSPLDYYNPEFDGIGADAISYGEVYETPIADPSTDTSATDNIFGYTERYNAYRYGRDVITGEFRNYNNNGDMNAWHTGRNLSDLRTNNSLSAQSSSMNTLEQTGSQYNRMFSVTDASVNHFYLTAQYNVSAVRPMMNLNQVVRLGEGDTNVPRNGNVIN